MAGIEYLNYEYNNIYYYFLNLIQSLFLYICIHNNWYKLNTSVISRPTIFPLPEFVAKLIFEQMGEEMLLGWQKAVPNKLLKAGFKFQTENIQDAIKSSL